MNPIFLYIKRHKVTGKCYFGKTTKDPLKYNGSGLHWSRHCKQHGFLIETLWFQKFIDQSECTKVALKFSKDNDIVKSNLWLNLKPENGLDGNVKGVKYSDETKAKMSKPRSEAGRASIAKAAINKIIPKNLSFKGKQHSIESRLKMSASRLGLKSSIETRIKISTGNLGKHYQNFTCPQCQKVGGAVMKRWHFNRCKYNSQEK